MWTVLPRARCGLRAKPWPHVHEYCNTDAGFNFLAIVFEAGVRPSWHSRAFRETARATIASSGDCGNMCRPHRAEYVRYVCMCNLAACIALRWSHDSRRQYSPRHVPHNSTTNVSRWRATRRSGTHDVIVNTSKHTIHHLRMCKHAMHCCLVCARRTYLPQHNSGIGSSSTFQNTTRREAPYTPLKNE